MIWLPVGCYLTSDEMIGGEAAVFADPKLPGLWRAVDKPAFFLILAHKDGSLSFRLFEPNFQADSEFYAGRTTRVGSETFINVRQYADLSEKPKDPAYIPVSYTIHGDKLSLAIFNTTPFDAAIAAKQLQGEASVKRTYSSTPTRLKGSGEEIAKFITSRLKGKDLLDKPIVFERLVLPAPAAR